MTITAVRPDPPTTGITTTITTASTVPPGHWTGASPSARWPALATSLAPELATRAAEHDRTGDFVIGELALLRQQGFMSMLIPAELGGGGATYPEACAALAELARGCPSTALSLSMHTHLVAAQVWRHHHGLPAPVLARVATDQIVLISTGASDWLDSSGAARQVDGGFRVSGRKTPASACPAGDVLVTSIRWEGGPDGPQVIHAAVAFTAPGVSIEETWDSMGMRATGSHTVVLDDVFVPDGAISLIRPAGTWHPVWSTVVGVALPLIMACYVGVAEAAAARAVELASRRSTRPEVAPLVGRMLNQLTIARDSVRSAIEAAADLSFDNTVDHAAASLARKAIATDAVTAVGRLALEVGGGAAYGVGGGIERLFRDLHGSLYHPLPTAQQERFAGRLALGLDPIDAG